VAEETRFNLSFSSKLFSDRLLSGRAGDGRLFHGVNCKLRVLKRQRRIDRAPISGCVRPTGPKQEAEKADSAGGVLGEGELASSPPVTTTRPYIYKTNPRLGRKKRAAVG